MKNQPANDNGVVKSVMAAYMVLALHLVLILALGLLVIIFRGIVQYMLWIFLIGIACICVSGFLFYRRMKAEGRNLREMLNSPMFRGRSVEISLLGGIASFKLGHPGPAPPLLDTLSRDSHLQLEDPESSRVQELSELARLLEKNLITLEEFNQTKRRILGP